MQQDLALVGESLLNHIKALFKANSSALRVTCLGHSDVMGSSIPVANEESLVKEVKNALTTIEAWESIKITNSDGKELFCVYSSNA